MGSGDDEAGVIDIFQWPKLVNCRGRVGMADLTPVVCKITATFTQQQADSTAKGQGTWTWDLGTMKPA